jgi:hypothetical protein
MTLPNAKTPKQEPRPLSLVEEKRQQAQHDLDHWSKVAALPELSTKAAEWARKRRPEVKLRERALAWAKLSQQQKLDQSKADHQKWLQVAARPGLSPEAVEFATNAARSSGAAAKLYEKALAW